MLMLMMCNYHCHSLMLNSPIEECLPEIYKKFGVSYTAKIVPSILNEVLKTVALEFDVFDAVVNRNEFSERLQEALHEKLNQYDLRLHDSAIVKIKPKSKEVCNAIESHLINLNKNKDQ
eukprot:TRINITY_DN783_c0_g1_i2.p1 TRINITY_DN783_c0_g1~~TRINITY_DN783_c0_g1_i2.p1  ORF type:complete len:119 (-),score=17.10 TRINITY_DN783_c0_g1_i2:50-406(-)